MPATPLRATARVEVGRHNLFPQRLQNLARAGGEAPQRGHSICCGFCRRERDIETINNVATRSTKTVSIGN
jgi:hypothetical protein